MLHKRLKFLDFEEDPPCKKTLEATIPSRQTLLFKIYSMNKFLVSLDWFSSLFSRKKISGNQSINSSNFPYQTCLIPNLPADLQHQVRDISNYIAVPFDTLLAVTSFICNALVFITVTRNKSLQHPSLLMLCSLSISDLIWALFTLVKNSLTLLHPYMCLKESLEKTYFSMLCYLATLSNLAMISRDRYLAMSRPTWYRNHVRRSCTRVVKATLLTWISSMLTTFVAYILNKTATSVTFIFIIFILIFLFYVVCIVMILLNQIGFFVANRRHSRNLHTRAGNMRAAAEKEKKLTQIISVILLCFLLSFLPALISPVIIVALRLPLNPFRPFNYLLLTFNGLLNPLLNYGRNREIRKAMLNMLRGRYRGRRISNQLPAVIDNCNTPAIRE